LINYPSVRYNFLILCYVFFVTSGYYYFLSINLKNLPGNTYINGVFIFSLDIVNVIIIGYISNIKQLGRRGILIFLCSASIVTELLGIFADHDRTFFLVLMILNRLFVSGFYCIIYFVSNEVYPTVLRSKGLGINSVFSRIGGIVAPIVVDSLNIQTNLIIFTILHIFVIITIVYLEDTFEIILKELPNEENEELIDNHLNKSNIDTKI